MAEVVSEEIVRLVCSYERAVSRRDAAIPCSGFAPRSTSSEM